MPGVPTPFFLSAWAYPDPRHQGNLPPSDLQPSTPPVLGWNGSHSYTVSLAPSPTEVKPEPATTLGWMSDSMQKAGWDSLRFG